MRTLLLALLIVFILGCGPEQNETTTKGNLHIFIPESIAPVMIDEVNDFLSLYQQNGAHITYTIVSSETAARHFVQDTSRIAFVTRPLTQEQKEYAQTSATDFHELIVAYDGIVAVVHPKNKIEQMTTTEIQKVWSGTITRWEQLVSAMRMKGNIKILCQDSSDVKEYLTRRMARQPGISTKFIHTTSDLQTLQFVEKDPLSLGFVALNWIDSLKSAVKILSLGRTSEDTDTTFAPSAEAKDIFFSPHPANIYRNYYPLKRSIHMYTRTQVDLAVGFGTFVASAEGQKLFLQHGILPGTQLMKLKSR